VPVSRLSNRALEVILTADLFDAQTAASYGWINRALPADELEEYVDRVARNIAALPDGVIEAAKHSLPADDFKEGLHGRTMPGPLRSAGRPLSN
jgi:enoyl-CoA hydratase/carnithine racemase